MIDFSYMLSRREGKIGTPEKPLSNLGLMSYRRYWAEVIIDYLDTHHDSSISLQDISARTGVNLHDIISTMQSLNMIKYWRTKHVLVKRSDLHHEYAKKKASGNRTAIEEKLLRWTPLLATDGGGSGGGSR